GAYRHELVAVLEPRPADLLALDHVDLHAGVHRDLDRGAGDLTVAHLGVPVAQIEQGALDRDREVRRVADAGLGCIHVAAVLGGHDRAARLERRRYAEATQERMQRDLRRELRVERLEGRLVLGAVDRIEPDLLGGRVFGAWGGGWWGSSPRIAPPATRRPGFLR